MEQESRTDQEGLEKYDIKLKSRPKNGVILQLHHTVRGSNGSTRRIRFSMGTFDDCQDRLACADNSGNLFMLDFSELKFWKLTSIGPATALHFVPNKLDTLLACTKNKEITFLDIDSGQICMTLLGHTAPVKHISFSNSKFNNLLTASPIEAILWEMTSYTKYFTLNTSLGAQIQQIMFMPGGDYLVSCFQNDVVQIWKHEGMKSEKQIIPNELKHMKSIAFTTNGRAMAMAGLSPTLILFSIDTWKAIKYINLNKFNITGAQQIAFIPQVVDGGANKILAILSSECKLHLLDFVSMMIIHTVCPESGLRKFVVSPSGKYFLGILQLGEVNIYNSAYLLDTAQNAKGDSRKEDPLPSTSGHKHVSRTLSLSKVDVEEKMKSCMDSARLRRILMQYGEYPETYRSVIWRSLLNTPKNKVAYAALVDKGIHPSYKDIEKQFTIHSSATLRNLKRLLSCLAHWCPLFAVMKFLPAFVFPFVKVLQKDPLLLFECVATILLNYCQLWFEYAPFPPISILAMAENILAEHDQHLLDHYCKASVTSQTYALKILETAFSEVLTCSEWLILWDHILSNEPAFIIMAVVAYSIVQRNAIKKLKTQDHLNNFFHNQNPIDKKLFLKKTYVLLNDTSADIHPRKFFNLFVSLDKGNCYQQFTGYPKATICFKLAKKEKKVDPKSNKYSLKDLTKQSQQKQINDKLKIDNVSENSSQSSDEVDDAVFSKSKNKNRKHAHRKQTHAKDLLDQIMHPTSTSQHDVKAKDKTRCDHSKSKIKKQIITKKDILENEVEMLIKRKSGSDDGNS